MQAAGNRPALLSQNCQNEASVLALRKLSGTKPTGERHDCNETKPPPARWRGAVKTDLLRPSSVRRHLISRCRRFTRKMGSQREPLAVPAAEENPGMRFALRVRARGANEPNSESYNHRDATVPGTQPGVHVLAYFGMVLARAYLQKNPCISITWSLAVLARVFQKRARLSRTHHRVTIAPFPCFGVPIAPIAPIAFHRTNPTGRRKVWCRHSRKNVGTNPPPTSQQIRSVGFAFRSTHPLAGKGWVRRAAPSPTACRTCPEKREGALFRPSEREVPTWR